MCLASTYDGLASDRTEVDAIIATAITIETVKAIIAVINFIGPSGGLPPADAVRRLTGEAGGSVLNSQGRPKRHLQNNNRRERWFPVDQRLLIQIKDRLSAWVHSILG